MSADGPKEEASQEGGVTFSLRIGAGIFCSLIGAMFGLCLGAIFFATEIFVLCGVIAGALTGAVFPEVSSLILIGAVRFFFGIFSLSILRLPKNLKKSPLGRVFHVKATFLFGISYAILAAICFYL